MNANQNKKITEYYIAEKVARTNLNDVLDKIPEINKESFWALLMEWHNAEQGRVNAWYKRCAVKNPRQN